MLLESDLKESDFMWSIQIYDTYNIVQDLHLRVCDITLLGVRGGVWDQPQRADSDWQIA
jgi:hypothetical protein